MSDARRLVTEQLAPAAARFPDLPPDSLNTTGLDDRDTRLAVAIHRTVLQRWLTIEHILDQHLKKPAASLEPMLRAVLLAGAAQLLFLEKLPAHAVVSESVTLARKLVRPGAAGLVNAVLRRVAQAVAGRSDDAWSPAPDALPVERGTVALTAALLPPIADLPAHLAAATSCPQRLVRRWIDQFGEDQAMALALHALRTPPTVIAGIAADQAHHEHLAAHEQHGCYLWQGTRAALHDALTANPSWRVQDPASTLAVASLAELGIEVTTALDYCAGRGTKTRQLAALFEGCRIIATDTDATRRAALREAVQPLVNVSVMDPPALHDRVDQGTIDLLLLDVPCSNTGVLARRPEARYRFGRESLRSLRALQRRIIDTTLPFVRAGGHVLYSTCSLEQSENQDQVRYLADRCAGDIINETLTTPYGEGATYHDGSYYALVRTGADGGGVTG